MGQYESASDGHDPRRLMEELRHTRAELGHTRAELATARRDVIEARARAETAEDAAAALTDLAVAAPGALWVAEVDGRGVYISPGVEALLGVTSEAVLPEAGRWLDRVHPDDRVAVADRFEMLRAGEAAEVAYRVLPPGEGGDGATGRPAARWVSDLGFPIMDEAGRVRRVAGFARPAGAGAGEEGLRRLLLAELNHRVRNALAAVQSVASSTARTAADPRSLWEAFAGRLRAMARAHHVVAGRGWTEGADLRALLEAELAPYLHMAGSGAPFAELDGPPVRLAPAAALAFALALHELATNAARHGALSLATGRVRVRWTSTGASATDPSDTPLLRLIWMEEGGPPLMSPPRRRGFRTRLLTSALPSQLGGSVSLDFSPSGLRAIVEARLVPRGEPVYTSPPTDSKEG